jgi:hypothetical protein
MNKSSILVFMGIFIPSILAMEKAPMAKKNLELEFYQAAERNDLSNIKQLIAQGLPLNPEKAYTPPLMTAVEFKNLELLDLLLKSGAKPDIEASTFHTPLMLAAEKGADQIIKRLIEKGANVNAQMREKPGNTVLMFAIEYIPHPSSVALLLNAGANPNLKNKNGKTAFDLAADHAKQQKEVVMNFKNKEGQTELADAQKKLADLEAIIELLKSYKPTAPVRLAPKIAPVAASRASEKIEQEIKSLVAAKRNKQIINYANYSKEKLAELKNQANVVLESNEKIEKLARELSIKSGDFWRYLKAVSKDIPSLP